MNEDLFQDMAQSIIDGEPEAASELAQRAVDLGVDPMEAINRGFIVGVNHVGEKFSCGDMFLPELVVTFTRVPMASRLLSAPASPVRR